jgi:DnaJ-class molecular chaperone
VSDPYEILGVKRGDDPETIKSAYRKLAMEFHPDRNPDGEEKFKEIQSAYDSITKVRPQSDEPPPGWNSDMHEQFERAFRARFRQPQQNADFMVGWTISLTDAFTGCEIEVPLPNGTAYRVTVPKSIHHGQQIRIQGAGSHQNTSIRPGDLYVVIHIQDDGKFERYGDHLVTRIEIDAIEAMVGTKVKVSTINEKILEITVPAGTQYAERLRVPGHGMYVPGQPERGDLLAVVAITIPKKITEKHVPMLETLVAKASAVT